MRISDWSSDVCSSDLAAFQASAVESANPSITRTDPGYITAKATWLRASGRDGEARALLAAPRSLAKAPTDAEEWLETLLTNARLAESGGDKRTASNIARQLDHALLPGTVVPATPHAIGKPSRRERVGTSG